jgi:hypothetical protein
MLYHPIKHPLGQYGHYQSSIWRSQITELWDICKKWNNFYVWEYLWRNYYRPQKWTDWARSANLDYYPIIQTNAPVEGHWSELKRGVLKDHNRPRLDYLAFILVTTYVQQKLRKLTLIRTFRERPSWHKDLASVWHKHQRTLQKELHREQARQEEEDQEESQFEDQNLSSSPIVRYGTDTSQWICACESYAKSTYHLCKHLISLHTELPSACDVVRQSTRPLLWIQGLHADSQRTNSAEVPREGDILSNVHHMIVVHEDNESAAQEDMTTFRHKEKLRAIEDMMVVVSETYEALKFVYENFEPGHLHLSEIPTSGSQYFQKWVAYARAKAEIDRKRVRVPTWGKLRKGFRYYSTTG